MRISSGAEVDVSGEELYIDLLFLILLCELAGRDFLVYGARLVTGVEEKTISEPCLTF